MKKSILQTIDEAVDVLQAAGFCISGMFYMPEEEKSKNVIDDFFLKISINKKEPINFEKETEKEKAARQFMARFTSYKDDACEIADDVYNAYSAIIKQKIIKTPLMNREEFFDFVKTKYKGFYYTFGWSAKKEKTGFMIFQNLRLDSCLTGLLEKARKAAAEKPCFNCTDPGCEDCPNNPENPRVKLYTPEDAIKAMLAGEKLKNKDGLDAMYSEKGGFTLWDNKVCAFFPLTDFSGLYREERSNE